MSECEAPDYRAILKDFMSRVIGNDHVVALLAVEQSSPEYQRILLGIGREITQEEDNEQWMWERFPDG